MRLAAGGANLLLGCDLVVAASLDALAKFDQGVTRANINTHEKEERTVRRLTAAEIGRLAEAVGRLLAWIPDLPRKGPVPFAGLCLGLSAALEATAAAGSDVQEHDAQALRLIATELGALAGGLWDGAARDVPRLPEIGLEAALDRVRTAVSSLSVGASAPRPGHLHVSGFSSGGYSGRPSTFVLGPDDSDFPGRGLQDPVLLDAEREALSQGLATTADSLRENVYSMAALLASLRGRVIFSFPAYDILEDRAPSRPRSFSRSTGSSAATTGGTTPASTSP